jgi:hypothetical protein
MTKQDFASNYLAQSAAISQRCWVNQATTVIENLGVSQSIVQTALA